MAFDSILKELRQMKEPERRIWWVFAAVFLVSQPFNISAMFPDYTGWMTFGFPLNYLGWNSEYAYSYFNVLALAADLFIMFIVARILFFGYRQMTKYKVTK